MRAELVAALSTDHPEAEGLSVGGMRDREATQFAEAYRSMDYGWRAVNDLAKGGRRLPSVLEPSDEWLWRMWRMLVDGRAKDPVVSRVLALRHPSRATERYVIEALLLALETPIAAIGERTGLGREAVECYASLFYAVRDRAEDQLLIASLIYPDSRLVEMYDRYLETESFSALLKRASYNNGLEDVLYLSGLSIANGMQGLTSSALSNNLEQQFMANARTWTIVKVTGRGTSRVVQITP